MSGMAETETSDGDSKMTTCVPPTAQEPTEKPIPEENSQPRSQPSDNSVLQGASIPVVAASTTSGTTVYCYPLFATLVPESASHF